mgnify:FL=1
MKKFFSILFLFQFCYSNSVSITGSVFNEEGKPSRKASVKLLDINENIFSTVKTNRKGRFELLDIKPEYYFLQVDHPKDGRIILKINPRSSRNRDLVLRLVLKKEKSIPLIYTFSNVKPIQKDPALRTKNLRSDVDEKSITITWNELKQANYYKVFRDEKFVTDTKDNVFIDLSAKPGIQYCYKVMAFGKFGLSGIESDPLCNSRLTEAPKNVLGSVNKNNITLNWEKTEGAKSYKILRNGESIATSDIEVFEDIGLEFSTTYLYSITSISMNGIEGLTSIPFQFTTRDYVEPPALSSFSDQSSIKLIWNEVELAKSYNLYRDGGLIGNLNDNTYDDKCAPGETHCYQITSIDKYSVESELSGRHCSKLNIVSPKNLSVVGGVKSNQLSWEKVAGAFEYFVYTKLDDDSTFLIDKTKNISFLHENIGFDEEYCYTIIAVDSEGDQSGFSKAICGKTNKPPFLKIKNLKLIDDSEDNILSAREEGKLRLAILNDGESPSENISVKINSVSDKVNELEYDTMRVIDNLGVEEAKYIEFDFASRLKIKSGDWKFQINVSDKNGTQLDTPYEFIVSTKSVEPPKIIIADYSIENSFGTNYIPKDEVVELTIRVQNVGAGLTEKLDLMLLENHTYSSVDFTGLMEIDKLEPGDFIDLDFKIKSSKDHFGVKFETVDYLDNKVTHQVDLALMKHFRSKINLVSQEIGAMNVNPYPLQADEVDIEANIPIGKRNVNNMAILLAIDNYDDINFTETKFSGRDGKIFRLYMQNLFGMDDYQLYPSKSWQMEDGPSKSDIEKIFDPHQGVVRNRVISSSKYSNIDYVDINIFYSGLGYWLNKKPYLIPRDGKKLDTSSYASLEDILLNLSKLSVLENINSITIFLDVKYINFEEAIENYKYPKLSKKLCLLASSSSKETSNEIDDMKHSVFSYFLMKGLKGDAYGDDKILEIGELAEYLYRKIPDYTKNLENGVLQNPEFIGSDLKRVLIDLR